MRSLTGLLVALLSSFTGRAMAGVCLAWLVLERTGSAGAAGLVAAATTLPLVVGALLGGSLVDRVGARPTSITADLATATALAAIPVWDMLAGGVDGRGAGNGTGPGGLLVLGVLVLAALAGTSEGPGGAAREALLPAVVGSSGVRRERANSWYKSVEASTLLLGPVCAGLLVTALGVHTALWATATAFAVAALVTAVAVRPSAVPARSAPRPTGGSGRAAHLAFVAGGLGFARADRAVRTMAVLGTVLLASSGSLTLVVLPVHLNRTGSAADLGLALGALGAGLVVGTLAYGFAGFRLPRRPLALGCLVAVALGKVALVALPGLPWLVALMALNGLAAGPLNPLVVTVLQERTPPELRGRVFGAVGAVFVAATPVGALLTGVALDAAGIRPVLLGLAVLFGAATVAAALSPGLHDLGGPAPAGPAGAPAAG